jgi:hypothetical protein
VDGEREPRARRRAPAQGGRRVGERDQPVRRGGRLRGYRESGFGREGGREGMWEYLQKIPSPLDARRSQPSASNGQAGERRASGGAAPAIDRTPKLYVGGKQARPDSGYSQARDRRRRAGTRGVGEGQPQGPAQRGRGGAQGELAGGAPRALRGRRSLLPRPRTWRRAARSSRRGCAR